MRIKATPALAVFMAGIPLSVCAVFVGAPRTAMLLMMTTMFLNALSALLLLVKRVPFAA